MSYISESTIKDITTGNLFKNRIINGDFSIWQRGTSFTFAAGQWGYTADRFAIDNITDGQITVSKSTLLNKNAIRITVDTPATDLTSGNYVHGFVYKFEGQHLYDLAIQGKNVTISFWFNSNVTGVYSFVMRNRTYQGQTGSWDPTKFDTYVTEFNYTTANTPQKIVITIPLNHTWTTEPVNDEKLGFEIIIGFLNQGDYVAPSTNNWLNGKYLTTLNCVNWVENAGNFIEIAELQLEEGDIATEFEHVPYEIQLMRCMRYYEVLKGIFPAYVNTSNRIICTIPIIYPKRTIPALKTDFLIVNREPGDQTDLIGFGGIYYTAKPNVNCISFDILCSTNLTPGNSADCSGIDFPYLELDAEL